MGVVINPGERPWYTSPNGITIVGTTKTYPTWDAMLQEHYPGKLAWVVDASGDPTVNEGSALYVWREYQGWVKIYETESMDQDVGINKFVGWVSNPDQLNILYPVGEDGMFAIIGTTDSIWVWDSDTQSWLDTGRSNVELNNKWENIEGKPEYYPSTFELVVDESTKLTLAQTINNITSVNTNLTLRMGQVEQKLSNLQISDIQGLQETFGRLKPIAFTSSWNDLVDIPATFTPSEHKHPWSDITSPPDFSRVGHRHDWTDLDEVPHFDELYAPIDINFDDRYAMQQHNHIWVDIQGVPDFALANHNHDAVYAPRIHTHTITEVVNLQETITELQQNIQKKLDQPTTISAGQMIVLSEDGSYVGQDIPGGDVTSEEFNNLTSRVTVVETSNQNLEQRVKALEEVVFEVDQLADQALDLLGYTEHRG